MSREVTKMGGEADTASQPKVLYITAASNCSLISCPISFTYTYCKAAVLFKFK